MKLLLMVERDGLLVCVKQFGRRLAWAQQYFAKIPFGDELQPKRGWLVEAASADQERGSIEGGKPRKHSGSWKAPRGRIIASGGKP